LTVVKAIAGPSDDIRPFAGLCARAVADHMMALGTICGGGSAPHCGWCAAAAA
jgi:hypothetical protein